MKDLLKFITCGSVDDGKSTLIGRMLYDAKLLFADQKRALELDSRLGSRDGKIDYSLLLDGLMAEREQGITIDVAYRYFSTENRSFIVADTPGHEEYTRNMAVGASFADLAIILVDATKGIISQTKRHTRICTLMGIKHIVLAVNKMDLIQYDENCFKAIEAEFLTLTKQLPIKTVQAIPVSATEGDNITASSPHTYWYTGEPLLTYLDNVKISRDYQDEFILPVQRVSRPNKDFRGFQGQIEAGQVTVGDQLYVLPTKETAKVKHIFVTDKEVEIATMGQPVTIQLDSEVDVSRGNVLSTTINLQQSNHFVSTILWMDDRELSVGENYYVKLGSKLVLGTVISIKHKVNIHSGEKEPVQKLEKNEIAMCEILLAEDVVFDTFTKCKTLGSFILINRVTNMTAACGVVEENCEEQYNIFEQTLAITREIRSNQKDQKPMTFWFTGLSGAGKSTLANEMEKRLVANGYHTMVLDGDNIRLGLNKNLSFTEEDRAENIRRVAEVAKLMNDAGIITIVSFISPFEKDRVMAREIIGESFVEVYVSTPLEQCEQRDTKGLYRKARAGHIPLFTGISSPYEAPRNPEIEINTAENSVEEATNQLIQKINQYI